jgi:hypothetical protein
MISSSRVSVARQAVRTTTTRRSSSTLARSKIPRSLATVLKKQQNLFLRPLQYSTERVLKLRGQDPLTPTLYDGSRETENCGVGLIAHLKSNPSRYVVDVADEMLVRMAHRGGCGCDPASGDGAGKLAFSYPRLD